MGPGKPENSALTAAHHQALFTVRQLAAQRFGALEHAHAIRHHGPLHQGDDIDVFPAQQAGTGHQRDPAAEVGEGLGKLAADGAAAEHRQTRRQGIQGPDRVRGDVACPLDAGQIGNHRRGAGGQDDGARGQDARPVLRVDLHRPGRRQAGMPPDHLHPQGGVAFHRIVRFHLADHRPHPLHDGGEIDARRFADDAELACPAQVGQHPGGTDQGLGRHAAGVQAITAHASGLDQGHLRLHGGGDVGGHQATGAGADDDQVAVEAARLLPAAQRAQAASSSAPPQLLP